MALASVSQLVGAWSYIPVNVFLSLSPPPARNFLSLLKQWKKSPRVRIKKKKLQKKNGDYVLLILMEEEDYLKGKGKGTNIYVLDGYFRSFIFEFRGK